jgi:PAS domain S-box-containing protein
MLAFIRSTYFQGLLDSFQTGVILFNDAGRAYAVNEALPGLLGTSREHLAHSTWDAFFLLLGLNEDLDEYLEAAGPLDRPRPLPAVDFGYEHPDGRSMRLSLSRSLLVDYGKLFGITVQVADMTGVFELHEREKRMLEENRLLQRHRAQGLQKLSMAVAHQIRNPLMTVGGFSDLLLRRLPRASAEAGLVIPLLASRAKRKSSNPSRRALKPASPPSPRRRPCPNPRTRSKASRRPGSRPPSNSRPPRLKGSRR